MKRLVFLFVVPIVFTVACKAPDAPLEEDLVSKPEQINSHISKTLDKLLDKLDTAKPLVACADTLLTAKFVAAFYKEKKFEPIWSSNGLFDHRFYILQRIFRNARDYGLVPRDLHSQKIDSIATHLIDSASGKMDAARLAEIELLMTDGFFVMANQLHHGRVRIEDTTIYRMWDPKKLNVKLDSVLSAAYESNTLRQSLESFEPKFEQYFLLKRELRKFIADHKDVKWCTMPDIKKDTAAYMDSVKLRMVQMNFYDTAASGNDSVKLAKALRKFQRYYRLTEDGKVGNEMLVALNYTIEKRIRQIEMVMDRWRTEPRRSDKVYVWVNLPGFNLRVAEADTLALDSRIICGSPKHPTPLLKSQFQNILVYPYWNVPRKIAVKEILPRIKWDTTYLRKQHFDVLDWNNQVVDHTKINWKKYTEQSMPYKFRQGTGEDNSLGVMKFNFYNKYDVYIHDTNAKKLFGRTMRAMSHGCMRLEKYFDFASFLIRDDSLRIRPDTLMAYIEKQEQRKFNLRKNPNLYVKYFSCEVIEGKLLFYPDIYFRDELMEQLLYGEVSGMVMKPEPKAPQKKVDPVKTKTVKVPAKP